MAFERTAWLYLDGRRVDLDDTEGGWGMAELDLGYPEIRDVTNNRPVQHGIDDQTRYFGPRAITAKLMLWGGTVKLDDIPGLFAPFMDPMARAELHYTTISASPRERLITVRAAGMSAPMPSPWKREMQLSWVAPDPIIRDGELKVATAWTDAASGPTAVNITTPGETMVPPRLFVHGPVTGATVAVDSFVPPDGEHTYGAVYFKPDFTIEAGHYVDLDCLNHRAYLDGDTLQRVIDKVEFTTTIWPWLLPAGYDNVLTLTGAATDPATKVECWWRDLYLT
jgi:hypothetical protein